MNKLHWHEKGQKNAVDTRLTSGVNCQKECNAY